MVLVHKGKLMTIVFYSGLRVADDSSAYLRSFGSPKSRHHATLMYSKKLPVGKIANFLTTPIGVVIKGISYWVNDSGQHIVARFSDKRILERHNQYVAQGCEYGYSYQPHITLEINTGDQREKYKDLIGKTIILTYEYLQLMQEEEVADLKNSC